MTDHPIAQPNRTLLLKLIALGMGYALWYILGNSSSTVITVHAPLCFYNVPQSAHIEAPETITLTLAGKRSTIRALNQEQLAIHLDATTLHPGRNSIAISRRNLMLPAQVKLVQYVPSNPVVHVRMHADAAGDRV